MLQGLFSSGEQPTPVETLQRLTLVGPDATLPDQDKMLSAIDDLERILKENPIVEAANVLGRSLECYTAWYVRGDDRKAFLERARDSYRHAKNNAALARLLVEEAQVRNLEEAIPLLESIYNNSTEYDPVLCAYVDALYKDGQYMKAYEVGVRIQEMGNEVGLSSPPTAPITTAAKALRAEAKRLKKAGRQEEVIEVLNLLQQTGHATRNDMKLLERLSG